MHKFQPETLGYIAGALTTLSLVPQVIQVYRTRSTKDVSLGMFALFSLGVLSWLLYGLWIDSTPVIWANAITLALALSVLYAKWRWR